MKRILLLTLTLFFLAACGTVEVNDNTDSRSDSLSKEDAATLLESGELDYDPCEAYGWYDDGQCDSFCPNPDPACDASDDDDDGYGQCDSDADCFVGGCSGQLCTAEPGAISTCEWHDSYACYQDEAITTCGCNNGVCGWAQTNALKACIEDSGGATTDPGEPDDPADDDQICAQVIVYATNPETGECKEFPTPCDVPEGWDVSYSQCASDDAPPAQCQSDADCFIGGCSGQVCSNDPDVITTCEWRSDYACYQDSAVTSCGCFEGSCGWEQTDALEACLGDASDF